MKKKTARQQGGRIRGQQSSVAKGAREGMAAGVPAVLPCGCGIPTAPSLKAAHKQMLETASRMPTLTTAQIQALVGGSRLSQFRLRRRTDRYLLALCLSIIAVLASILWRTASFGLTAFNMAVLLLSVVVGGVALRAARSLWLMWQASRHRVYPYRMAHYADRLASLSFRRRRWLGFVLHHPEGLPYGPGFRRLELVSLRLPSYSIAACLLLLIGLNSDKAFAATRDYVRVVTTSHHSDGEVYIAVNKMVNPI